MPTNAEWNQECLTWSSNKAHGAFASPLKLPMGGRRHGDTGQIYSLSAIGAYWSSSASNTDARGIIFTVNSAFLGPPERRSGLSVRCIKD